MRAIMVMFDSLNREFLPNYGCDWTHMPNFQRLGQRTATFDRFYGGSMPCMPARRELHTGRYNFLHTFWTPMHPYDDSVISHMKAAGIYTHICTDHFHYWAQQEIETNIKLAKAGIAFWSIVLIVWAFWDGIEFAWTLTLSLLLANWKALFSTQSGDSLILTELSIAIILCLPAMVIIANSWL